MVMSDSWSSLACAGAAGVASHALLLSKPHLLAAAGSGLQVLGSCHEKLWFWRAAAIASSTLALASASRLSSVQEPAPATAVEHLHWMQGIERRGLEDLIIRVNHIALIVSDVGRSLTFYSDVLGFQQIQRPNFDRHGAWLTMGNCELHLIKGRPHAPDGEDLIVGHVAFDTDYPERVLQKLIQMKVPFRQNVSVPDPNKARNNLSENFDSSDGKVTQYFLRDPDGYYVEICNCEVLTKFCLFSEEEAVVGYTEGSRPKCISATMVMKLKVKMIQLIKRARANLNRGLLEQAKMELHGVKKSRMADEGKLNSLLQRQKTFGDVTQAFTKHQIEEALKMAGNLVPQAILLLELKAVSSGKQVLIPPQYLVGDEKLQPRRFSNHYLSKSLHKNNFRFSQAHVPKAFADQAGAVREKSAREKTGARGTALHRESFLGTLLQHLPQLKGRNSMEEIQEGDESDGFGDEISEVLA